MQLADHCALRRDEHFIKPICIEEVGVRPDPLDRGTRQRQRLDGQLPASGRPLSEFRRILGRVTKPERAAIFHRRDEHGREEARVDCLAIVQFAGGATEYRSQNALGILLIPQPDSKGARVQVIKRPHATAKPQEHLRLKTCTADRL